MLLYISRGAPRTLRASSTTSSLRSPITTTRTASRYTSCKRPISPSHIRSPSPITASFIRNFLFGPKASPEETMAAQTKAEGIINDNPVAVFSKSYCPYCKASKQLLSELGVKPYIIELDQVDDGAAIQQALKEITGQSTVPNVFIGKKHIGGNSDLQGKKGELPELLKSAGAI